MSTPLQDAVKKITGDELPDFYNIVLERPKVRMGMQPDIMMWLQARRAVVHAADCLSCDILLERLTARCRSRRMLLTDFIGD